MRKFLAIIIVTLVTAGCSGSGSNSLFSALAGGSSSSGSSGGSNSGSPIALVHNPEPSSIVLLGTGLAALALAALKKKKKG